MKAFTRSLKRQLAAGWLLICRVLFAFGLFFGAVFGIVFPSVSLNQVGSNLSCGDGYGVIRAIPVISGIFGVSAIRDGALTLGKQYPVFFLNTYENIYS